MDFNIPNWVGPLFTSLIIPAVLYVRRLAKQVEAAGFATKADVDSVKKDLADERKARHDAEKRLSTLEQELGHLPNGDDIRALSDRLVLVEAALKQLPTVEAVHALDLKLERLAGAVEGFSAMQAETLNLVRQHQTIIATAARG